MGKSTRVTIWALLVALILAFGDGPFLDEAMAEDVPSNQVQFTLQSATESHSGTTVAGLVTYLTLLSAAGAVQDEGRVTPPVRHALPAFIAGPDRTRSISPAEKPPRLSV